MKRFLALFLLTIFLFPACRRTSAATDLPFADAVQRVQNSLGGSESFTVADEDFFELNFGKFDYVTESAVCFDSGNDTREIGLFLLSDRSRAAEFKQVLRNYLDTEKEALSSLAALYPAEELETRLSRYQNALVGSEGMLVYYFVLDQKDTQKAFTALTGRQQ